MTTQTEMLAKIRSALADRKDDQSEIPPPPEVWPVTGLAAPEMAEIFRTNLEAVQGECVLCTAFSEAIERIRLLLGEIGAKRIAVLDRPLSRQVAEGLDGFETVYAPENAADASPEAMKTLDAGLVSPEYLLADTGSCLFAAPTAFDRLATYLMPVAVVIAEASMLRENLPAVWPEVKPRLEAQTTGEHVIVTGPSRTADIEKILILGVHGPKRLVVFIVP